MTEAQLALDNFMAQNGITTEELQVILQSKVISTASTQQPIIQSSQKEHARQMPQREGKEKERSVRSSEKSVDLHEK